MKRFFLVYKKRLMMGKSSDSSYDLVDEAYEYINEDWIEISPNQINDRLMGYDPTEDSFYSIGNLDIMDEIEEITEKEAKELMK
ncbi:MULTISPECIES: hypothetical protein [Helcococcus]|uniref:Uncharacterized protein n=1 Tax=Helcococcus bovis TaxID=3153252 RepID=A0ABW9F6I2_9FIRM